MFNIKIVVNGNYTKEGYQVLWENLYLKVKSDIELINKSILDGTYSNNLLYYNYGFTPSCFGKQIGQMNVLLMEGGYNSALTFVVSDIGQTNHIHYMSIPIVFNGTLVGDGFSQGNYGKYIQNNKIISSRNLNIVSLNSVPSHGFSYDKPPLSSWNVAYLNDKKMHAVSVGKTFQFTKIKNADGTPHTGGETETFSVDRGGLTATGFKTNPSEGLFLERSNELLPGTFVIGGLIFGSKAGNYLNGINKIINNATDPLSGVSQGAKAYVRNINENMTNVSKIISQGNIWTGTILKAKTFMSAVGSGSPASMSLLGAMGFGTMMGLSVIAGIELGNVVVDKVKEYVTPQGTYKLDKYSNLFDIYQTSDYIDGLIQQAEANANAQNESSATTHADSGTNSAEQIDEWEKQQAEAQAQADAQAKEQAEAEKATLELENEKLKSTLLKNATDYLSQITGILDFNFNNIPKKQDILDIDHEESTTTVEELNKAKRNMKAWENLHSQVLDNHTDTQGNEQEFTKGLVGILKSFAPATLNEHLTRVTGKNLGDTKILEEINDRIDNLLSDIFQLHNIKEEILPSVDNTDNTDFDVDSLKWYYSNEGIKKENEIISETDEGVV